MSSSPDHQPDELAGTEAPFVSHLIELRDRLLHSVYGVGAIFILLCLYPGPSQVYDLLALPLVKSLPEGSKMIAVGVVSPFLIPIKVTLLAGFGVALPWVLYQVWAFVAPGLYRHEQRLVLPLVRPAMATVAVFTMIPIWNDLWFPLILAPSEATKTITLGSQVFIGQFVTNWNAVLAALGLAIVPVLVLYLIFSRQLIRGITAGAVK